MTWQWIATAFIAGFVAGILTITACVYCILHADDNEMEDKEFHDKHEG